VRGQPHAIPLCGWRCNHSSPPSANHHSSLCQPVVCVPPFLIAKIVNTVQTPPAPPLCTRPLPSSLCQFAKGLLEELGDQSQLGQRGEGWTVAQFVVLALVVLPPFHSTVRGSLVWGKGGTNLNDISVHEAVQTNVLPPFHSTVRGGGATWPEREGDAAERTVPGSCDVGQIGALGDGRTSCSEHELLLLPLLLL
jgi:hypothetical protein